MPFSQTLPPAFVARMQTLLGPAAPDFFAAYDRPLCRGLRVNTLKVSADRLLPLLPFAPEPVAFAPDSVLCRVPFRAGADPLHHAGAYYMQEPSALSAVTVLAPRPGERVLDLCAAPGGKSTQIAAALQGQGLLWCNEYVHSRAQVLTQNLERCGVKNAVVSSGETAPLCNRLAGFFDAVLADVPCSGEGMFRKEPEALSQWSEQNIRLCAARGQGILAAAASAVAPGGRLVYSTCTFAPEENECQIAQFLAEHPDFELADTGVSFGQPAFSPAAVAPFAAVPVDTALPLFRARRILPPDGEGHFVALLRRREDALPTPPVSVRKRRGETPTEPIPETALAALLSDCFVTPPTGVPVRVRDTIRLLPVGVPELAGLPLVAAGVTVAAVCKNRLEPAHGAFLAARPEDCRRVVTLCCTDPRLNAFLKGEVIAVPDTPAGYCAVAIADVAGAAAVVTGFGKVVNGLLKNHYPKGLRLRADGAAIVTETEGSQTI